MAAPTKRPGIASLLFSSKYSDFSLSCHGQQIPIHKAIVCTRSPVIAAACDGNFSEGISGVMKIEDFDLQAVRSMLQFLYTGEYDTAVDNVLLSAKLSFWAVAEDVAHHSETSPRSPDLTCIDRVSRHLAAHGSTSLDPTPLEELGSVKYTKAIDEICAHIRVNAIAEFLDVEQLREYANTKIANVLETSWSTSMYLAALLEAGKSTGDPSLRALLTNKAASHIEELVELNDFGKLEIPNDYACEILQKTVARHQHEKQRTENDQKELKARLDQVLEQDLFVQAAAGNH